MPNADVTKIAIIGFGPKGFYALERLLAQYVCEQCEHALEIHVFNSNPHFATGHNYAQSTPPYLLMNYASKHIDLFPGDYSNPLIFDPQRLDYWLADQSGSSVTDYSNVCVPRRRVGAYLQYYYDQLLENLPAQVQVKEVEGYVNDVIFLGDHYSIGWKYPNDNIGSLSHVNWVMLSTGHPVPYKFDSAGSAPQIHHVYPLPSKLSPIRAQENLAVMGFGLTMIDTSIALSEGRGGSFLANARGKMQYLPSGEEPNLFVFSKSGTPMIPRSGDDVQLDMTTDSSYVLSTVERIMERHGTVDFSQDILPMLQQDMEFQYYKSLMGSAGEVLEFNENWNRVQTQIIEYLVRKPKHVFKATDLFDPWAGKSVSHDTVVRYLKRLTNRTTAASIALTAAAHVWKTVSPAFGKLYSHGGLTSQSHRDFDQNWRGVLNRIAYGPPLVNMRKVVALAEAGVINFKFAAGPKLTEDRTIGTWILEKDGHQQICDWKIDARIPKLDCENPAGIYKSLIQQRLTRMMERPHETGSYYPGCIETGKHGEVHVPDGLACGIYAYGTPTEGVTYDNDTLSRKHNDNATTWSRAILDSLTKHPVYATA